MLQALRAFAPDQLRGKCVLVRSDNTQAVAAVSRGATRAPEGRPICREIALLAVRHGFTLRAEHLPGAENARADRLSRRLSEARQSRLQLRADAFRRLCPLGSRYAPSVDCCCDARGQNRQPGCTEWFSADRSVLGQAASLAGRVLWAFPPPPLVGEVLQEIWEAYSLQPRSTSATVLVPDWPEREWHRRWVAGGSPFSGRRRCQRGSSYCSGLRASQRRRHRTHCSCCGYLEGSAGAVGAGAQGQSGASGHGQHQVAHTGGKPAVTDERRRTCPTQVPGPRRRVACVARKAGSSCCARSAAQGGTEAAPGSLSWPTWAASSAAHHAWRPPGAQGPRPPS